MQYEDDPQAQKKAGVIFSGFRQFRCFQLLVSGSPDADDGPHRLLQPAWPGLCGHWRLERLGQRHRLGIGLGRPALLGHFLGEKMAWILNGFKYVLVEVYINLDSMIVLDTFYDIVFYVLLYCFDDRLG